LMCTCRIFLFFFIMFSHLTHLVRFFSFFFFSIPSSSQLYTLSLHDALPILLLGGFTGVATILNYLFHTPIGTVVFLFNIPLFIADRKSTRLNSSHVSISYAVFCLKKKKLLRNINYIAVATCTLSLTCFPSNI